MIHLFLGQLSKHQGVGSFDLAYDHKDKPNILDPSRSHISKVDLLIIYPAKLLDALL